MGLVYFERRNPLGSVTQWCGPYKDGSDKACQAQACQMHIAELCNSGRLPDDTEFQRVYPIYTAVERQSPQEGPRQ